MDRIADWSQAELRRFIVNTILNDPGAIPSQIPRGARNTVLHPDEAKVGGVAWAKVVASDMNVAFAVMDRNAVQSVNNAVQATVVFDSTSYMNDPQGLLTYNSGTGVFTVNRLVWLQVHCELYYAGNITGSRLLIPIIGGTERGRYTVGAFDNVAGGVQDKLEAGTTFTLDTYQNSGVALNFQAHVAISALAI